ncbi:MAG: hypothetical protein QOD07_307 [Frankiaceae bacterium]|nr:hypothetical protein [Frankiaceae bacterium]
MRRRRFLVFLVAVASVAVAAVLGARALLGTASVTPGCTLGHGPAAVDLDPEQAADAATIAGVALRLGLPDHAVTIALATALQESKLYNLSYGDRDSLGVFQQRPSQGWGTPRQLMDPAYAAAAFYTHLARIPGWESLPVSTAAQMVQRSADGSAYVQWEEEARALARVLTGEVEAGLACRFDNPPQPRAAALTSAATAQLGTLWSARGSDRGHDWATAEWLVAHAYAYGVVQVDVRGMRWTSASGRWRAAASASPAASYRLAPLRSR